MEGDVTDRTDNATPPRLIADGRQFRERLIKRLYTVPELMRLTRLTRKQVTHWADIGLISPTLRDPNATVGQPASFYSATDALKALILADLRRRGFTPSQMQQVARNLREHEIQLYESEAYLLTDGYSVYYAFSDGEVVDVLKHRGQMLLVPIHEQVAKLQEVA
jgi:DNA-binding transcriptional MerR regulator